MTWSSVNLTSNLNIHHFSPQKGRTEKKYFFDQFCGVVSNGEEIYSATNSTRAAQQWSAKHSSRLQQRSLALVICKPIKNENFKVSVFQWPRLSALHCKESCSPAKTSGHMDMVTEATKIDLAISRLCLKTKLEEQNFAIKGLSEKCRISTCASEGPKAKRKLLKAKIISALFIRLCDKELVLNYGVKPCLRTNWVYEDLLKKKQRMIAKISNQWRNSKISIEAQKFRDRQTVHWW